MRSISASLSNSLDSRSRSAKSSLSEMGAGPTSLVEMSGAMMLRLGLILERGLKLQVCARRAEAYGRVENRDPALVEIAARGPANFCEVSDKASSLFSSRNVLVSCVTLANDGLKEEAQCNRREA